MRITTFFVLSLLLAASLQSFALDYTITFTGTSSGASITVGDVLVQNLTNGTSVTVPSGNTLNLTDKTAAVEKLSATDETIHVYPTAVVGTSTLSFYARQAGITQLNAFSLDGRKVAWISTNLQTGSNTFELSLPKGIFVIQVSGNEYAYTAKIINQSGTQSKPGITYVGTEKPVSSIPQKSKSTALGVTTMTYATGDQLLYKATSGTYSTIVTDVPTAGKTTNFNFVACTDADGNNYTTVTIGNQTWMAENLKTTTYNDGITAIPLVTDNSAWTALSTPAYCWYNNDATTYKNKYGALYNWYTVNTAKLAPTGWHVPTDAEWTTLTVYVTAHLGNSLNACKALAATTDWTTYSTTGTIGNNLTMNNSTGFSVLPVGGRLYNDGTFYDLGLYGFLWSATELNTSYAWGRYVTYYGNRVYQSNYGKANGFSVRCVRDSQ